MADQQHDMEHDAAEMARERAASFEDRFKGRRLQEYRGIPIFAAPGVHERALKELSDVVPRGASVLDLGAGGGAMSQRLADAGYAVSGCDLFEENFTPAGRIPFHEADLNAEFSTAIGGEWDAVVALEIVEHLENPRHVLRECAALLKKGGVLVMSTPNIANPVSQSMFVRSGHHQWFGDQDYREQGHIMPLSPLVLRRCFLEQSYEMLAECTVANPFRQMRSLRKLGFRLLGHAFSLVSGTPRMMRGEVYLSVWRRG